MIRIRVKYTVAGAVLCAELYARPLPTHSDPTRQVACSQPPVYRSGKRRLKANESFLVNSQTELKATNKWPDNSNSLVIEELGIIL